MPHENLLTITPASDALLTTTYNIYRSDDGGATFVLVAWDIPQSAPKYDDANIAAGAVYLYYATAVDGEAESPPSNWVTLTAQ
jgi:fibronectin type 3 domain-containing protein